MSASTNDNVAPVVLVVEDEGILRMNAADMLADDGFTVIEAANAAEALTIMKDRPDIRVLFTDVNMPGMDGLELAERVHAHWPNVLLLVTSGHEHLTASDVPDDGDFVSKPYGKTELLARVHALFDTHQKAQP